MECVQPYFRKFIGYAEFNTCGVFVHFCLSSFQLFLIVPVRAVVNGPHFIMPVHGGIISESSRYFLNISFP